MNHEKILEIILIAASIILAGCAGLKLTTQNNKHTKLKQVSISPS